MGLRTPFESNEKPYIKGINTNRSLFCVINNPLPSLQITSRAKAQKEQICFHSLAQFTGFSF